MGDVQRKKVIKKILENWVKKLESTIKSAKLYIQNVGDGIQKLVNLNTFCSNLTFKNRYTTSKNGPIARLVVTPPIFWNCQRIRKNVEIHHHFQSAFGTAAFAPSVAQEFKKVIKQMWPTTSIVLFVFKTVIPLFIGIMQWQIESCKCVPAQVQLLLLFMPCAFTQLWPFCCPNSRTCHARVILF